MALMLAGCMTSLRSETKEGQIGLVQPPKELICVANPELDREYRILEWSDIYTIGKTCEHGKQVTLHKLQKTNYQYGPLGQFVVVLGRLVSIGSLGILPIRAYEAYLFTYDVEDKGVARQVQYTINVQGKTSIWEIFRMPFVDEQKIIGLALRRQYLNQAGSQKSWQ